MSGAAEPGYVKVCLAVDATTHECTTEAWVPSPSLLPPMTLAQAATLNYEITLLLAAAWCLKKVRTATV